MYCRNVHRLGQSHARLKQRDFFPRFTTGDMPLLRLLIGYYTIPYPEVSVEFLRNSLGANRWQAVNLQFISSLLSNRVVFVAVDDGQNETLSSGNRTLTPGTDCARLSPPA